MKINLDSLAVKIVFFGISLVFISLVIFSTIFLINQRREIKNQITEKGLIFAEFSARSVYDDYVNFYTQLSEQGFSIFKDRTIDKLNNNEDIVEASLVSVNGRILFSSKEFLEGRYSGSVRNISDPNSLEMLKNSDISFREIVYEGDSALEIFMPISELSGNHVFLMRYIVSYQSFKDQLFIIYRQIILAFLLVFIFVILFSIPFYLSITKPIIKLSSLTKKISQGDLAAKIELGSNKDEIGVLAKNFNVMVDELRLSKEKASDYNKQLEKEKSEVLEKFNAEKEAFIKEREDNTKKIAALEAKNLELEKLNKFMVDRELKMVELKKKLKAEKV